MTETLLAKYRKLNNAHKKMVAANSEALAQLQELGDALPSMEAEDLISSVVSYCIQLETLSNELLKILWAELTGDSPNKD